MANQKINKKYETRKVSMYLMRVGIYIYIYIYIYILFLNQYFYEACRVCVKWDILYPYLANGCK